MKSLNKNRSNYSGPRALLLIIAAAVSVFTICGNAKAADGLQVTEAQIDKILNALLDLQFSPSGFLVAPQQINYEDSPEYQKIDGGSTWKLANERLGILYTAKQKPFNDRSKPNIKAFRSDLIAVHYCAAELFGGGSSSGKILNFAEADTEWIIANLDKTVLQVTTDDEIKSVLPKADNIGIPEEFFSKKIDAFFTSLYKAEKHLTKNQVNVLRREFITCLK